MLVWLRISAIEKIQINQTAARASKAGTVCTKKIRREAVTAPYAPATATQSRKKLAMRSDQVASDMNNAQIKPAARNPL